MVLNLLWILMRSWIAKTQKPSEKFTELNSQLESETFPSLHYTIEDYKEAVKMLFRKAQRIETLELSELSSLGPSEEQYIAKPTPCSKTSYSVKSRSCLQVRAILEAQYEDKKAYSHSTIKGPFYGLNNILAHFLNVFPNFLTSCNLYINSHLFCKVPYVQ